MDSTGNRDEVNWANGFSPTFYEKQLLKSIYLCVLVKGLLPSGDRGYCYFGIFGDTLTQFVQAYCDGHPFNPRDIKAIVLARSTGEPSPEIREFMRNRFSFSDDQGILEVSRG